MNPERTSKFYYTYVLQSIKTKLFYTGFTSDLRKRFNQHNNDESTYTKGRGPFELIYYEVCIDHNDAAQREKYFKSGRGKRFLKSRLKRFLVRTG